MSPPKCAPGCACRNDHSILVTVRNHLTSGFRRCGLLTLFFYKKFNYNKIYMNISVRACLLDARKENLTGVSTGLTGRSKNLDPTGNPIGRSTRPVSISAS